MESLNNLLGNYNIQEPDEVSALKQYIADEFNAQAKISVRGETLIITVASASLANALRLRTTSLKAAINTDKRLVFRIG